MSTSATSASPACKVATAFTQTGALTGTLAYLAPEVIEGRPASAASDLYALACLGYECFRADRPFRLSTRLRSSTGS